MFIKKKGGCAISEKNVFLEVFITLPKRWNTCMKGNGNYIEKWSHCVPFVFSKLRDKNISVFKFFIWLSLVCRHTGMSHCTLSVRFLLLIYVLYCDSWRPDRSSHFAAFSWPIRSCVGHTLSMRVWISLWVWVFVLYEDISVMIIWSSRKNSSRSPELLSVWVLLRNGSSNNGVFVRRDVSC